MTRPPVLRLSNSELTWLNVQLDPPEENNSDEFRLLTELCIEKLVSDVCLFRNLTGMPKCIHLMLLFKALAQNRTLSISQLMKYSPCKEMKLPVPDNLKSLDSIVKHDYILEDELKNFKSSAKTVTSTFLCLIEENCSTSQLEVVDLGYYPWTVDVVQSLYHFFLKYDPKKFHFSKTYTIKSAYTVDSVDAADCFIQSVDIARSLGFHLVITGLEIYNNSFTDAAVLDLMDKLKPSEVVLFTLNFAHVIPSVASPLIKLQKFKNLRCLNCSYLPDDFMGQESLLTSFAITLTELPHLTRLILRGNRLSQSMEILFQRHCKRNTISSKRLKMENIHCCTVHGGSLEYLDISSCRLTNSDILFLKELPLANTLKYLNVSYNSFEGISAFQTLLSLSSSLLVLNMENSFRRHSFYNADYFPLSSFTNLRYLNIRGLKLNARNEPMLNAELDKMPNLLGIEKEPVNLHAPDLARLLLPADYFLYLQD